MQTEGINPMLGFIRDMRPVGDGDPLTDGQLLGRFVSRRDEAAFETLLHRHGTMVLRICRRALGESHAAEDAFQATFLVFVRKAASIRKPELLANWLYGVAYRVATRARQTMTLRLARERHDTDTHQAPAADKMAEEGMAPRLHEELQHLPAKYRAPMVLCYLEGLTNEEAARQLQWPLGTIKVRLMRGREMLRARLTHRGFALSGAALTALLAQEAVSAALPSALVNTTIRAALLFAAGKLTEAGTLSAHAVALSQGVLKTMLWTKLKIAAAVLLAVGLLGSAGWLTYATRAADQEPVRAQPAPKADGKEAKPDNKNSEPKKVPLALEKSLAEAARKTYKAFRDDVEVGKALPSEMMCKWSARWLEAQFILSDKKSDRIALFTAHRDRIKDVEKFAKKYFDEGKMSAKDYWPVKYFLLEAEIRLARVKSGK